MTNAIVPLPSREDREYARLMVEIETRKRRISRLQSERDGLELALSKFYVAVKGQVDHIRAEMNRVKLKVAEYRRRIQRIREDETLDPTIVEQEVAAEFAQRAENARSDEESADRAGQQIQRSRPSHRLDPKTEAEILRVYRELAKRFHPDLAKNEVERKRRSELMLRINVAYSERDLLALQTIARQAETIDPALKVLTPFERIAWARRVLSKLDSQIGDLESQLGVLRESETFALWQSPEMSQQNVEGVEKKARERLNRERDRLDEAILDYNRILRRRRMPRATSVMR